MKEAKHIIDCDEDPIIPKGWEVIEHRLGVKFEWDPTRITLFLSDEQQKKMSISGHILRKRMHKESTLNSCVLAYLLKNPQLIPKSWKEKQIYFWGTIYRNSRGDLSVLCLYWNSREWSYEADLLDYAWASFYPAAVLQ